MPPYRYRTTTYGRSMAGAQALWRATGMTDGDFDKPIIANSLSGTALEAELVGKRIAAHVVEESPYDPENARLRG